jgi:hypothetical protein
MSNNDKGAEMKTWTIARNEKTSLYEIHAAGCKHLIAKHLEVMSDYEAATGAALKETFEARNEDCFAKLGPCAK